MVPLSKSGRQQCLVGSNPTLSVAMIRKGMERNKVSKILGRTGLALEIVGPAMAIHHRTCYGKWRDDKGRCHGNAGLALTGIGIPLIIAGNRLSKRDKKQIS